MFPSDRMHGTVCCSGFKVRGSGAGQPETSVSFAMKSVHVAGLYVLEMLAGQGGEGLLRVAG